MEKEKVDKAALGYDYKGETEKHQSQKGTFNLCCYIDQHPGPNSYCGLFLMEELFLMHISVF